MANRPTPLRDVESGQLKRSARQIRELQRSAPDVIVMTDDDGLPRVIVGQQPDGSWGISVYTDQGDIGWSQTF